MDIIFEANFSTTGTPEIKIYSVVSGVYTLVKTDDMSPTGETGKYSYNFVDGDTLTDYSARMTLGAEKIDGVFNSIFTSIFARSGGGGGGSIVYSSMTKSQVQKIVDMSKELFIDALNDINVSLPDGFAEKEINSAINKIKDASDSSLKNLQNTLDVAIQKKTSEIAAQLNNNYEELIQVVEDFLYEEKAPIQNEVVIQKDQELEKRIDEKINILSDDIKTVEKVARKSVDATVLIEKLLTAVKEQANIQEKGIALLLKELIK